MAASILDKLIYLKQRHQQRRHAIKLRPFAWILLIGAILLPLMALSDPAVALPLASASRYPSSPASIPQIISPTPDFMLTHTDGKPRRLSEFREQSSASRPASGLPVITQDGRLLDLAMQPGWKVIYFWSATCPCVRACESFTFVPLSHHYQGKVSFYAVASNGYDLALPPEQLAHQAQSHHLPFALLLDKSHLVARFLDAKVTPQAFLLDPQGHVVFAGIPDDSRRYHADTGTWGVTKTYLAQAIMQALASKLVTVPKVKDEGCIIAW